MDKKTLIPSIFLCAITVLIFFGLTYADLSFFKAFERIFYDLGTNLQFNQPSYKPKIALISIDEKSLTKLGPLPWSRNLISHMIDTLEEGKIQTIGIDLSFYNEEQNRGLKEIKALEKKAKTFFPSKREKRIATQVLKAIKQAEENSDNDLRLAESIDNSKKVILPFFGSPEKGNKKPRGKKALNISKDFLRPQLSPGHFGNIFFAASLELPLPSLAQAAFGLGHNRLFSTKNIYERSHPPAIKYQGALLPSFPLRVAMAYLKVNPEQTIVQDGKILLKEKSIPLVNGDILFRCDKNSKVFLKYSFVDILQARKAPSVLKGKIALIGQDIPRNKYHDVPFSSFGVSRGEISANIVDNILNNRSIKRPKLSFYYELSFLILLLLITAFFFTKLREVHKLILMLGIIAIALLLGVFLLSFWGVWFKMGSIATCLAAFYLLMSARQLLSIDRFAEDAVEANRALGLSLKNQGLLDLALEKFMTCPLDNKTKDNIYELGLEFEQRNMVNKALTAFKYINRGGGFRDLDERIKELEGKDISSESDGQLFENGQNVLSTTFIQGRGKVGRFRILEELGKGTMGLVYKGLDPKINRLLAIKIIRFSDEFDQEHIQEIQNRFFTEAEIAGQLSHPSIVTIYDVGEDQDLTYMAMEYLEGKDLAYYSTKENLLPLAKVLDIVLKVADALEYAHQADVIHRDIKPANIMLLENGDVKVTDFGIAKAISSSRTKTGVILGTPNYMSPEQIMGYIIDARSDIFSLGVLFFQLLTGKLPFHGENLSNLLYLITQGKHPSVREFNKRIPKACEQIIDKAMAKDPEDRFGTAGDMAKYLKILLSKLERVSKK